MDETNKLRKEAKQNGFSHNGNGAFGFNQYRRDFGAYGPWKILPFYEDHMAVTCRLANFRETSGFQSYQVAG
ncbi:MAG: hypothetical protein CM1200mP41_21720 [Gammaproteobacteria bacterium]|nr:MAG: hypothetical protein CM1200mP41_21720 [Gammaproteobacteria bacterium]